MRIFKGVLLIILFQVPIEIIGLYDTNHTIIAYKLIKGKILSNDPKNLPPNPTARRPYQSACKPVLHIEKCAAVSLWGLSIC